MLSALIHFVSDTHCKIQSVIVEIQTVIGQIQFVMVEIQFVMEQIQDLLAMVCFKSLCFSAG